MSIFYSKKIVSKFLSAIEDKLIMRGHLNFAIWNDNFGTVGAYGPQK